MSDSVSALLAWARLWTPTAPRADRQAAWQALALPQPYAAEGPDFVGAFVAGAPRPRLSLLLHAALGQDGTAVREDWQRAVAFLGLAWTDQRQPPDHLGPATEVVAVALAAGEPLLAGELCRRYLQPWCVAAGRAVADVALPAALVRAYEQTLDACAQAVPA